MAAVRKFFVGGNWKSNGTLESINALVNTVLNPSNVDYSRVEVVVAPVALHLQHAKSLLRPEIQVSAQNSSLTGPGAFTGEIAVEQLKDMGINFTILGHSERRTLYGETDEIVANKVKRAQEQGLNVIACIGENLQQRQGGTTIEVVTRQLNAIREAVLDWGKIVIAYEPVWAIGTGQVATPEQAQEVHAAIRGLLRDSVNAEVSLATRIIYGGSVTDTNAQELIRQEDVDGFLVGGASLKDAFKVILETVSEHHGVQFP